MTKKLYFANDTHRWHGGSAAVCQYIRQEAERSGYTVVTARRDKVIEHEVIQECDVVLVNGEGTMHHNKARARHLMAVLAYAQVENKKTVLCNTVWQGMSTDYTRVLRRLDQLSVRDSRSKHELSAVHNVDSAEYLDFSYWSDTPYMPVLRTRHKLATDFWLHGRGWYFQPHGPIANMHWHDMRSSTWDETLQFVGSGDMLLTGRFHGVMAACRMKTPFVAVAGNTHKIEGFLEGFNIHAPVADCIEGLYSLAIQSAGSSYYPDLFAWMDAKPRWKLLHGGS